MRIGINGFGRVGRVGRVLLRIAMERDLEVVAVNDVTDAATLAHPFAHDSTYGRLRAEVEHTGDALIVDGRKIQITAQRDPAQLRWGELGVDVVIESTGRIRTREQAAAHLAAGAREVLISAPAKGPVDATIVMGVNQETYDPAKHDVISNASCTTNCVPPMIDVLHRPATVAEVNAAFEADAADRLRGVLRASDEPMVSSDIVGDPASCVLDSLLTQADGDLVKVFGWYDNEWGYSVRLADLAEYIAARLPAGARCGPVAGSSPR